MIIGRNKWSRSGSTFLQGLMTCAWASLNSNMWRCPAGRVCRRAVFINNLKVTYEGSAWKGGVEHSCGSRTEQFNELETLKKQFN